MLKTEANACSFAWFNKQRQTRAAFGWFLGTDANPCRFSWCKRRRTHAAFGWFNERKQSETRGAFLKCVNLRCGPLDWRRQPAYMYLAVLQKAVQEAADELNKQKEALQACNEVWYSLALICLRSYRPGGLL